MKEPSYWSHSTVLTNEHLKVQHPTKTRCNSKNNQIKFVGISKSKAFPGEKSTPHEQTFVCGNKGYPKQQYVSTANKTMGQQK